MKNRQDKITSYKALVAYRKKLQTQDKGNTMLLKRTANQKTNEWKSKINDLIVPASILIGGTLIKKLFVSDSDEKGSHSNDQEQSSSAGTSNISGPSLETWLQLAKVVAPVVTTYMASQSQEEVGNRS